MLPDKIPASFARDEVCQTIPEVSPQALNGFKETIYAGLWWLKRNLLQHCNQCDLVACANLHNYMAAYTHWFFSNSSHNQITTKSKYVGTLAD